MDGTFITGDQRVDIFASCALCRPDEHPQYLTELDDATVQNLIDVNVSACSAMTRLVLPKMVERGRGAVCLFAPGFRACARVFLYCSILIENQLEFCQRFLLTVILDGREVSAGKKALSPLIHCGLFVKTRYGEAASHPALPRQARRTARTQGRKALFPMGGFHEINGI